MDTPQLTPSEPAAQAPHTGLSTAQAAAQRRIFGKNELEADQRNPILMSLRNIVTEPMFILLAVACALYFFLGDITEALMMVVSILFVAGIELYQETKSERALEALRKYTRAQVRTLRDGAWAEIPSEDLVPDDVVRIEEGEHVPADGVVLEQHDLTVDESVLTGESLPAEKVALASSGSPAVPESRLFHGSQVASGNALMRVVATGSRTEFGKLGKSIETIETAPTPLQQQIKRFVRNMGIIGGLAFVLVFALNYGVEGDVWKALLFSLTL
ncbi:MAG TPA: HAD-IC family P-type ATPase, partial [Saprospiraceae bacterium]|nr:HAD-IC family P-type ATPase [Saprospiraceae bacterium]